jgi:hypothetical protein
MKKVYIAITYSYAPNPNSKGSEDKWLVTEMVEFLSTLKNKHVTGATLIIEATERKLVKSRSADADYDTVYEYVKKSHPAKIEKLEAILNPVQVAAPVETETPVETQAE